MNELKTLESFGLTLPSPLYIAGSILFGIIGFVAYRYGKKTSQGAIKWIGIVLMFYPYAVSETWLLYLLGAGLCVALYLLREF